MERRLTAAARRHARAVEQLRVARDELRAAVHAADTAGLNRSTIIRLAGVTRQTVYNWLNAD